MDSIRQQVTCARRRLNFQQFVRVAPWTLFGALLLAVVALAIPKIWALNLDRSLWNGWWIGGALALGFCFAVAIALWRRHGMIEAAIELASRSD